MREVTAFLSLQLLPQLCPILGLPPSSFLCQDSPCPPFPTVPGCLQSPLTILPPQPSPCLYCEMAPGCLWAPRDHPWCGVGDQCLPGMPTDGPALLLISLLTTLLWVFPPDQVALACSPMDGC